MQINSTILRDGLVMKGKYSEFLGDHMEESSPDDLNIGQEHNISKEYPTTKLIHYMFVSVCYSRLIYPNIVF